MSVRCGLSFVIVLHRDDDFASSVTLVQIAEGLRRLAERVRPVNERCELASFNELPESNQVLVFGDGNNRAPLLAHEQGQQKRLHDVAQAGMAGVRQESPLGGERASAV